jgi:hypothetical protein
VATNRAFVSPILRAIAKAQESFLKKAYEEEKKVAEKLMKE